MHENLFCGSSNGAYGIYRDSYPTSGGFDTFSMKFVENPTGVFVLASYYDDSFVQKVAMFTIDGDEVVADVGDGYVTGAVSVGGNIYVQTDGGTVTAISPTYETRRYAVGQLFGSTSFSFDRGSLFVSPTGDLGVVAKNLQTLLLVAQRLDLRRNQGFESQSKNNVSQRGISSREDLSN